MKLLVVVASSVHVLWIYSGIFLMIITRMLGRSAPDLIRHVFHELRPFYLPAIGIEIIDTALTEKVLGWNILWISISVLSWWIYKDLDDDDRWKRRRKKLSEKVSRVGGRLVVVPVNN